ncbi:MAG: hypothetical protein AAF927_01805 [Bacteroidota bacterium]
MLKYIFLASDLENGMLSISFRAFSTNSVLSLVQLTLITIAFVFKGFVPLVNNLIPWLLVNLHLKSPTVVLIALKASFGMPKLHHPLAMVGKLIVNGAGACFPLPVGSFPEYPKAKMGSRGRAFTSLF